MGQPRGRRLPLSLPRRFVGDLLACARGVPLCTTERVLSLAAVAAARAAALPRLGWCAVFTKAYGLVARARPELRQAYIPLPWPHLYEHPESVASVAVERRYRGEDAVFFAQVRGPENQALPAIEGHLRRCKEAPIEDIALFRRILFTSRLPRPLRRLLWWFGVSVSGHRKARYLGTFGVSVTAAAGAAGLNLLTPVTTGLNYGLLGPDGALPVRLTYDHRVLDGGPAARALADLEEVLHGPVLVELCDLEGFGPDARENASWTDDSPWQGTPAGEEALG
jgi:hypothetical protein